MNMRETKRGGDMNDQVSVTLRWNMLFEKMGKVGNIFLGHMQKAFNSMIID